MSESTPKGARSESPVFEPLRPVFEPLRRQHMSGAMKRKQKNVRAEWRGAAKAAAKAAAAAEDEAVKKRLKKKKKSSRQKERHKAVKAADQGNSRPPPPVYRRRAKCRECRLGFTVGQEMHNKKGPFQIRKAEC